MIKRIVLLFIIIFISVLAGILPDKSTVAELFKHTGYYFVLLTSFLWVLLLTRLYFNKLKTILTRHYVGLLLSAVLMVLIFSISPPRFKVLADEVNLVGVSMSMYQSKTATLPLKGFNRDYKKPDYTGKIDKKPLLFPLLTSFFHTITGYSAYNGFLVNFFAGMLILFALYIFIHNYFSIYYAVLSVLLLASMPCFVLWVTSSGCETINLLFIIVTFFMLGKVIECRTAEHAELLFLTLALLAQCRFESIAFTIAIVLLIPFLYKKKIISNFTFVTYLIPILYIPLVWQPRLYADIPDINQMNLSLAGQQLVHTPNLYKSFSLTNLLANTNQNLFVFLGFDPHLGFTPVIAILAIFGLYMLSKKAVCKFNESSMQFKYMGAFGIIAFSMLYGILFSFYMGNLTLSTQNRFAMAFIPCMVFPAIYFLYTLSRNYDYSRKACIAVFLIFHLLYFWPYGSRQLFINEKTFTYEYNKVLKYIESSYGGNRNIVVISDRPNYYLIHYYGSVDFAYANTHKDQIINNLIKEFDHVLVLQRYFYTGNTHKTNNHMNSVYKLKELERFKITPKMFIRLSEVKNGWSKMAGVKWI